MCSAPDRALHANEKDEGMALVFYFIHATGWYATRLIVTPFTGAMDWPSSRRSSLVGDALFVTTVLADRRST